MRLRVETLDILHPTLAVAVNRQRARRIDVAGDFAFAQDDLRQRDRLGRIDIDLAATEVRVFQRRDAARAGEQAAVGMEHGLAVHRHAPLRISGDGRFLIREASAEGLDQKHEAVETAVFRRRVGFESPQMDDVPRDLAPVHQLIDQGGEIGFGRGIDHVGIVARDLEALAGGDGHDLFFLRAQLFDDAREFRRGVTKDEPAAAAGRRRRQGRRFPDRAIEPIIDFAEGIGEPVGADLRAHPEFLALKRISRKRNAMQAFVRVKRLPVDGRAVDPKMTERVQDGNQVAVFFAGTRQRARNAVRPSANRTVSRMWRAQ